MAARSTRITLSNNTPFKLTYVAAHLCHGIWTDDSEPPPEIQATTNGGAVTASWQSESDGFMTGTEGWVKYQINNTIIENASGDPCPIELLYIYWDNPYLWGMNPVPIYQRVTTLEIVPERFTVCDADEENGWVGATGGWGDVECRNQVFLVTRSGDTHPIGGITWWDVTTNWIPLLQIILINAIQNDINLEFTIGLRQEGSVGQSMRSFYDGSKGLRSLINGAGQPSLRKLFHLDPSQQP